MVRAGKQQLKAGQMSVFIRLFLVKRFSCPANKTMEKTFLSREINIARELR